MKQVNYQGYAQGGGFSPVQVSNASVTRIAQEGQRVLRGMQAQADQDLNNQRRVAAQMQRNYELEQRARDKNQEIRKTTVQNRKEDNRRDYLTQAKNLEVQAQDRQELFKSLSTFSTKAFEIAQDLEKKWFDEESDKQYWADQFNNTLYGTPPAEQLQDRENYHQLRQLGEAVEIQADMAQANGADPIQVDYFRGLNRAQRHGRMRAMIERSGMDAQSFIENAFETNDQIQAQIPGADGQLITLTPSQAKGSEQKAAFMPLLLKQYMEERGLKGIRPAMLEPFYVKFRAAMEGTLASERKAEISARASERINVSRDTLFDAFSVEAAHDYYNTLRRSGGMSHEQARKELMKFMATAVDEYGNLKFSNDNLVSLFGSAFPDQPNKPIGERYSADVAEVLRERANLENKLFSEHESTLKREHGEWNEQTRAWLNSGKWDGSAEALKPLIAKAIGAGNAEGVKMLQSYVTDLSNDGRNDKFYEELWTEKAATGLLQVEEVRTANVSAKLKLEWISKAEKSEQSAMPSDMKDSMEKYIEATLTRRLGQFDRNAISDPTFGRALSAAKSQYLKDFNLAMQKPGATAEQADAYALGRFEKEFQKEGGRYSVDDLDPNNKGLRRKHFSNFLVAPTSAMTHPLTQARDIIKQDPNAIENQPLLDRGELQRISQAVKAGKPFSIPKSAQYLANMLGGVSASDVLNAQMKHYGIDQIPLKAYEQAISSVDPEYQRLLTYQPNHTRVSIAAHGSGLTAGVATTRRRGAVNTPGEIMSTFLAAGGNREEAVLMTAIAMAESSGRQDAYRSDTDVYGWWQIRMGPYQQERSKQFGIRNNQELFNPLTNAKAAIAIRGSQGFGAWEAYTNGAYKKFLPQAEAAAKSFGSSPWRQGSTMNFNVVEYLTGDTSHSAYRADHGGSNYHEHVGFRTKADRDRAVSLLRREGIKIGSLNDGVHSTNSLHYHDRAVDLPMPHHIAPGSREERAYSKRVRMILGIS